jgi:hypothetical protein
MSFSKEPKQKLLLKNMENKGLIKSAVTDNTGELVEPLPDGENTPTHINQAANDKILAKPPKVKRPSPKKLKNMKNKGLQKQKLNKEEDSLQLGENDLTGHSPKHISDDVLSEQMKPKRQLQQQVYELEKTLNDWGGFNDPTRKKRKRKKHFNQLMRTGSVIVNEPSVPIPAVNRSFEKERKEDAYDEHNESGEIENNSIKFEENVIFTRRDIDEFNANRQTFYRKEDLTNYSMGLGLNMTTKKDFKTYYSDYEDYNTVSEAIEEQSDTKNESVIKPEGNVVTKKSTRIKRLTNTDFKMPRTLSLKRANRIKKSKMLPPLPRRNISKNSKRGAKPPALVARREQTNKEDDDNASPYTEKLVRRFKNYSPEIIVMKLLEC